MIDCEIYIHVEIHFSRGAFWPMLFITIHLLMWKYSVYLLLFSDSSQVLMNVLSSRKNMSDSLAYGRLHPQLQPNTLLVDCEFFLLTYLLCSCIVVLWSKYNSHIKN